MMKYLLLAASILLATTQAWADDTAGTVKRVSGNVKIERGIEKLEAVPGMLLYATDKIRTGPGSSVGITLRDETLFSAGANSLVILDKFSFNQTTYEGELQTTLKRGRLAVSTGKLAKFSPENVEFHTPDSILGVRGTEFILEAYGHDEG